MLTNVLDVPCLTSYHTIYTTRSSRSALHAGQIAFCAGSVFFGGFFLFGGPKCSGSFWRIPSRPAGTGVKKQGIVFSLSTLHLRNGGEVETINKLTALPRRDWAGSSWRRRWRRRWETPTPRERRAAPPHFLGVWKWKEEKVWTFHRTFHTQPAGLREA